MRGGASIDSCLFSVFSQLMLPANCRIDGSGRFERRTTPAPEQSGKISARGREQLLWILLLTLRLARFRTLKLSPFLHLRFPTKFHTARPLSTAPVIQGGAHPEARREADACTAPRSSKFKTSAERVKAS